MFHCFIVLLFYCFIVLLFYCWYIYTYWCKSIAPKRRTNITNRPWAASCPQKRVQKIHRTPPRVCTACWSKDEVSKYCLSSAPLPPGLPQNPCQDRPELIFWRHQTVSVLGPSFQVFCFLFKKMSKSKSLFLGRFKGLGGMGACGNHWKWSQFCACKIWWESVRKTPISWQNHFFNFLDFILFKQLENLGLKLRQKNKI